MKVFIDPAADIHYASFYVFGLFEVFGKKNVSFSSKYFKKFQHNNHFFAFVIKDKKGIKKIIVDFTDSSALNLEALDWCDVYGKINLAFDEENHHKIIAIGPSFGIQIFNLFETIHLALTNYVKAKARIKNVRRFFSDYKSQYLRPKLKDYNDAVSRKNYVFYFSSLWKNEPETNRNRAHFIESCKQNPNVIFEGGFAPRRIKNFEAYNHLTVASRIPMDSYLSKTKQSAVVFNTPAVKHCHGWKLAEYLCIGKAIISTPLSRTMPGNFNQSDLLLITDASVDDLTLKTNVIIEKQELKSKLEAATKNYFNVHLSPEQVIRCLINN